MAAEAFAYAAVHLASGSDALLTLRLMAMPDPSKPHLSVTVNGSAGLVRQALESTAFARWLLADRSAEGLQRRGFAERWADVEEQAKYLNSWNGEEPRRLAQEMRAEVADEGVRLELLVGNPGEERKHPGRPSLPRPAATQILAQVNLKPDLIVGLAERLGAGVTTAEWLYRWLSGMAHGYAWASLSNFEAQASFLLDSKSGLVDSGVTLGRATLNYETFNLALWTAIDLCEEVADRYRQAHESA